MHRSKYEKGIFSDIQIDEDYFGGTYRVALPDRLLPDEMKEDEIVIDGLVGVASREPIYCSRCNTVIPVAMIKSLTNCPFCHKEYAHEG